MMKVRFLWGFLLSILVFSIAKGEINVGLADGALSIADNANYLQQQGTHIITLENGNKRTFTLDVEGKLDVIVEFIDQPLVTRTQTTKLQGQKNKKADQTSHTKRFEQFQKDVEKIGNQRKGLSGLSLSKVKPMRINKKYSRVFSGAHLTLSSADDVASIESLPYVKGLYANYQVQTNPTKSTKTMPSQQVFQQLGFSGQGVTVAIIDSGIDYTHPALGGGFGEGYKVIGGYDFVNNDEDPMDDNGHGTHVAGIVAANNEVLQGVAPDASLMAYKVLDAFGGGFTSDIIAAIERTVDPNMDGDFSDRVDIANMSLGSIIGGPDDASSRAVDAAVAAGVTFVVAAGNDRDFHAIGSPASARDAITVGATSQQNQIASFSSKGPNRGNYAIKPEVLAPGVDIESTFLSGGYQRASGTSMSAPYVAGVAALLKEHYPDSTPAQIKSLIVGSAEDLNEEIMGQGAGRVDVEAALNNDTTAIPSTLNFGLNSGNSRHWTVFKKFKFSNHSNKRQRYKINKGELPAGVKLYVFPFVFHLSPGQSTDIYVLLRAKNRQVPFPQEGSLAYGGALEIRSRDNRMVNVPWSFVRAAEMELSFDQDFPEFSVFNETYSKFSLFTNPIDSKTFSFISPPGAYDILSSPRFERKYHITEQKAIEGISKHTISLDGPFYPVNMAGVDHNGTPLSTLPASSHNWNANILPPAGSQLGAQSVFIAPMDENFYVSPVSERYEFLFTEVHIGGEQAHVINYPVIKGINGDVGVLVNDPAEYYASDVEVKVPLNKVGSSVGFGTTFEWPGVGSGIFPPGGVPVHSDVWKGSVFTTPHLSDIARTSVGVEATDPPPPFEPIPPFFEAAPWLSSLPFYIVDNKIGSFLGVEPQVTTYLSESGLTFGLPPLYGRIFSFNNIDAGVEINIRPRYYGQLGEEYLALDRDSMISIYDENGVLLSSEPVIRQYVKSLPAGRYSYELSFVEGEYSVLNTPGKATYMAHIDLTLEDANPPVFTSIRLADESGQPIDSITKGEPASLSFSVADLEFILDENGFGRFDYRTMDEGNASLYLRELSSETWQPVALTHVAEDSVGVIGAEPLGHIYSTDLSNLEMQGDISIKMSAEDASGNVQEWIIEPGFVVSGE